MKEKEKKRVKGKRRKEKKCIKRIEKKNSLKSLFKKIVHKFVDRSTRV